jgi:hypothetical protein
MEKQLHILKSGSDLDARSIIEILCEKDPERIKVVLIQAGIEVTPTWKGKTYRLNNGSLPLPLAPGTEEIDYSRFVDLIFEADTVVGW